jgi:TonB family protein
MKVCPKCQASFAEGFVYCPRDAELLVRYDLRARWHTTEANEFNFLLTPESLSRRLGRELRAACLELRRDPRGCLAVWWRGGGGSQRRKQMLQAGVALAVIGYTFVVTALLLVGLSHSTTAGQLEVDKPWLESDERGPIKLIWPMRPAKSEYTRGRNGHLGGSLPQPQRAQGGGSGGDRQSLPASRGVLPQPSLDQQLKLPDPAPQKIKDATLLVAPTIVADPRTLPYVRGQIGLPDAPPVPPSKGPGDGGGIGNDDGTGVGRNGHGAGFGPGYKFNTGGRTPLLGSGPPTGLGDQQDVRNASAYLRPTILYKEKAKYTEDARMLKIQGLVVLAATFNANGQITDIRVVRGLPNGLTEEAIQAAKRIRFQPAMENGAAVTVRAQLEYHFTLY